MEWYKSKTIEYLRNNNKAFTAGILVAISALIWNVLLGEGFEWKHIEPIPADAPHLKILSALVFLTLGNLLYQLKFYMIFSFIFVDILGDRNAYKNFKLLVWSGLMLFMGWVIIPWAADTLNQAFSLLYNIFALFVYLVPPVGIALALLVLFELLRKLVKIQSK